MKQVIPDDAPDGVKRLASVFCVCGDPDAAWQAVRAELRRCGTPYDQRQPYPADNGYWWVLAYLLDHLRLTEHGSSVGGAWLDGDGQAALDWLDQHIDDED